MLVRCLPRCLPRDFYRGGNASQQEPVGLSRRPEHVAGPAELLELGRSVKQLRERVLDALGAVDVLAQLQEDRLALAAG
jgi:hypothetical protein